MGWQYIEGSWDNPQVTDRENFKQVLISDRLRPILDIWIAAIVKRVGAFESLLGLIGRYVIA